MALLKGKGMMTGVNLIAKVYKTGITKDGKSQYIDVQVDARDPRGPEQTNLHLRSERVTGDDGKTRFNNGAPYSVGQMAEIAKAAGPNTEPILDKGGKEVGTLYGFKGNVMRRPRAAPAWWSTPRRSSPRISRSTTRRWTTSSRPCARPTRRTQRPRKHSARPPRPFRRPRPKSPRSAETEQSPCERPPDAIPGAFWLHGVWAEERDSSRQSSLRTLRWMSARRMEQNAAAKADPGWPAADAGPAPGDDAGFALVRNGALSRS